MLITPQIVAVICVYIVMKNNKVCTLEIFSVYDVTLLTGLQQYL